MITPLNQSSSIINNGSIRFYFDIIMRITKSVNFLFTQFVKLSRYDGPFDKVAKLELDNPRFKNALSVDLLSQVYLLIFSLTTLSKKSTNNMISELVFLEVVFKGISVLVPISNKDSTKLKMRFKELSSI